MDSCSSNTSEIHKLPVELLTEILILSSGESVFARPGRIPANYLCLVSRKWRDIALQTPSLWSSIYINLNDCWAGGARNRRRTHLLELLMQRSRSAPLTLSLFDMGNIFDDASVELSLILKLLISHCQRWETLRLLVPNGLLRHAIFSQIRGALPRLHSLTIDPFDPWDEDALTLFEECPALDTFECRGMFLPNIVLPWNQLTSITYLNPMADELARVLPRCHCLKALRLDEIWDDSGVRQRVLTPELTCLWLVALTRNDYFSRFLDVVQAPRLELFELEGVDDHPQDLVLAQLFPRIENFLASSSCSIRKLSFKSIPFTDLQLISVLRLMPTVNELTLEEVDSCEKADGLRDSFTTQTFLDHLRYRMGSNSNPNRPIEANSDVARAPCSLLPQLASLELRVFEEAIDNHWCDALAQAVISRWIPETETDTKGKVVRCACLKTLRLLTMSCDPFPCGEALGRLIALAAKEDGFELVCKW